MEAASKMLWVPNDDEMDTRTPPDPETAAFEVDVVGGLPVGDDLTASELRCDYLLEKLAKQTQRIEHVREFTARRVEMVTAHGQAEIDKLRKRVAWLERTIREHMPFDAQGFKKQYGAKSTRLPHGQIGYRKHPAKIEVVDDGKALAFARRVGIAKTKTVESVGKTELLEWIVRNGEDPDQEADGFRLVAAKDEFYITPDVEF